MTPPPAARFRLILFDLDGTLIDSRNDLALAVNLVLQRMRLAAIDLSLVTRFVGDGARKLMHRALREATGREPDETQIQGAIALFLEEYGRHLLDSTTPYPGVPEALESLRWARMAVVTNKPEGLSRRIMEGLGLAGYFEAILGGDTTPRRKPDPEPLFAAMRLCGAEPKDTLMVGDSPVDVQAGKAAGVVTCAITGGYRPREELEAEAPDLVLDLVASLPRQLEGD